MLRPPWRPALRRFMQLVVGTLAAFLLLVPGTAWAQSGDSTPAPPTLPPQLQQVIDQLSLSSPCSKAIQADLEKTLTDIPSLVTRLLTELGPDPDPAAFLTAVENALGIGDLTSPEATTTTATTTTTAPTTTTATMTTTEPTTTTATSSPDLSADIQQLITDLQLCLASGPTIPTTTVAPTSSNAPALPAADTSPPTGPVSYPGYAATGAVAPASFEHTVGTGPLVALGAGILLVGAGTVTAALRFRARRAGR